MFNTFDDKKFECYYLHDNEKIHSKIDYHFGRCFAFTIDNPLYRNIISDNIEQLISYNYNNKPILLKNKNYQLDLVNKTFYFENIIVGFEKESEIKNLKFKEVCFTFPYINLFFAGIDNIDINCISNKNELYCKYKKSEGKYKYKIDENFSFEICHWGQQHNSEFCFSESTISLHKSIKIIANKYRTLEEFLEIIKILISFVSFSLKRNIVISKIESYKKANTAKRDLKIYTFQYKIFDTDFNKPIRPAQILISYWLLNNKIGKIVQKFYQLSKLEYRKFGVAIDLYIRNQDVPQEPNSQISFLTYAQAIEALMNSKSYKGKQIDSNIEQILQDFKNNNINIQEIQNLKFDKSYNFAEKICKFIKDENIEDILNFEYYDKNKIRLVRDLVKIRNYYTHFSCKQEEIEKINIYELSYSTKVLLETFILKELGLSNNLVKNIIKMNNAHLTRWGHPYITIPSPLSKTTYPISNYLGDFHFVEKNQSIWCEFYYKKLGKNKIKLIIKNITNKKKKLYFEVNQHTKNKLNKNKLFKVCYERYLEQKKQQEYKK